MSKKLEGGRWLKGVYKEETDDFPLISVITVVYNGLPHLWQAMQSVLNQSYYNVEYIIIDGGSTDGSLALIKKHESQIDYWLSEKDGGIYEAMNKGVALARGSYIGFKNADDWYTDDIFAKLLPHFKAGHDVIYGDTYKVWQAEPFKASLVKSNHEGLTKGSCVDHRSAFIRAELHRKLLYDTQYRWAADYAFFLELFLNRKDFQHTGLVHCNMRFGGASDQVKVFKEVLSIQNKYIGHRAFGLYLGFLIRFYILKILNAVLRVMLGENAFKQFKTRKLR